MVKEAVKCDINKVLFPIPAGDIIWRGETEKIIWLIFERQIMREDWWEILESQFCSDYGRDDDGGWRGEYWGKLMRGASLLYSVTGNQKLYGIIENSVRRLLEKQDELGRICTYSVNAEFKDWDMWSRKYVMLGCFYFLDICKNEELHNAVIKVIKSHADYIIDHIGDGDGKKGIFETSIHWGCVNSSSILEPMVKLFKYTDDKKYLDFATYIVKSGAMNGDNIFELAYNKTRLPYEYKYTKAYEIMSCFEGLLEYAVITKSEKWFKAVINFVEQLSQSEITIVGTGGCSHELFDHSVIRQFDITNNGIMLETCVTVTWMKLCMKVYELTGNPCYADYIERAYYNAMLGCVNTENSPENGGMLFDSYSPLYNNKRGRGIGGLRILNSFAFSGCCDCIGATGIGIGTRFSYMKDCDGFVFNNYLPASINTKYGESKITFNIDSNYPNDGNINIYISADLPVDATLKFRIPKYSQDAVLFVNGERIECEAGKYAVINRMWENGDEIKLILDTSVRTVLPSHYGSDEQNLVAFEAGPLVLARDSRFGDNIETFVSGDIDSYTFEKFENKSFDSYVSYLLKQEDGQKIHFADYKSCGKTWKEDSKLSVWIRKR